MPSVEVLHRGRFHPIPAATARPVGPNAFEIRIPKDDPICARTRRTGDPESWDDAVFALDGQELAPALGSGGDGRTVWVTALRLG